MNEGRLFLYVSPNVFIPIMFLVMVLTSLSIHYTVLTNSTWLPAFFEGGAAMEAPAPEPVAAAPVEVVEEAPAVVEEAAAEEAAPAE